MSTIAILAPMPENVTPAQYERARRAMLEHMMLIARGLSIDHPAVRNAAEIVASAVTPDPAEFTLVDPERVTEVPARSAPSDPARRSESRPSDWKRDEKYARYLKTIYSTQPS